MKHIWRSNLQFVSKVLRDTWNSQAEEGHPPVPVFAALRDVVEVLATKMLTHVLERRRQQWQVSFLSDADAETMRITMNIANMAMEPRNAAGIVDVTANDCDELVVQHRDEVSRDAVDLAIARPHDVEWRAGDTSSSVEFVYLGIGYVVSSLYCIVLYRHLIS